MSFTHFIIKLVGVNVGQIRKAADFKFIERFKGLVFEGRAIPLDEFNTLVPKVLERYKDYMPRLPQVVLLTAEEAAEPVKTVVLTAEPTVETTTLSTDPAEPLVSEGVSQPENSEVEDTDAAGEVSPDPEPAAEVTTEPEGEAEPEPQPEPAAEPAPQPEAPAVEPEPEPEPAPAPKPSAKKKAATKKAAKNS